MENIKLNIQQFAPNPSTNYTETKLNELSINYLTEAQYEEAKTNGEINDDELYMTPDNNEEAKDVYSTSEVKTNKVWIDGKPIYRKVVNFGRLPNSNNQTVAHNISNIDVITNIYGTSHVYNLSEYYPMPLQYRGNDSAYNAEIVVDKTNIKISTDKDRSNYEAIITIEYTKTTDSSSSGSSSTGDNSPTK